MILVIVTLTEVKTYLKITSDDDDALLEQLRAGTEKFVKKYCGREFEAGTYTEYVLVENGIGWLANTPVTSITSAKLIDGTELNIYEYMSNGYFKLLESISETIEVTYDGGETPDDIKLAVLRLIEYYYNRPEGVKSQSFENTNVTFGIPDNVKEILDSYKPVRM